MTEAWAGEWAGADECETEAHDADVRNAERSQGAHATRTDTDENGARERNGRERGISTRQDQVRNRGELDRVNRG